MRRLAPFLAAALLFAGLLALSWRRQASFDGDLNREWTTPARIAAGERLYADVAYYYGPLVPWTEGAAMRLFGARVGTAIGFGILAALGLLASTLAASDRFVPFAGRLAVAAVGAGVLAFAPENGTFVAPYSEGALLAVAFAWSALVAAARGRPGAAGLLAGLALLSKVECAPALLGAFLVLEGRARLRFAAVGGLLAAAGYGVAIAGIPVRDLVSYGPLRHLAMPPEFRELYVRISGLHPAMRGRAFLGATAGALLLAGWGFVARGLANRRSGAAGLGLALLGGALLVRLTLPPESLLTTAVRGIPLLLAGAFAVSLREKNRFATAASIVGLAFAWRTFLWTVPAFPYAPLAAFAALPAVAWLLTREERNTRAPDRAALFAALPALLAPLFFLPRLVEFYRSPRVAVDAPRGLWFPPGDDGALAARVVAHLAGAGLPDGALVVLPEASALNFLLGVRSPLRLEQVLPGHLDDQADREAAARLAAAPPARIVVVDRPFPEFGGARLGRDYGQRVMAFVAERYEVDARFQTPSGRTAVVLRPKS